MAPISLFFNRAKNHAFVLDQLKQVTTELNQIHPGILKSVNYVTEPHRIKHIFDNFINYVIIDKVWKDLNQVEGAFEFDESSQKDLDYLQQSYTNVNTQRSKQLLSARTKFIHTQRSTFKSPEVLAESYFHLLQTARKKSDETIKGNR